MEKSYCTFGFGAIVRPDLVHYCKSVIHHTITIMIESMQGEATHACLAGLAMKKKKSGGEITLLHT